MLPFRMTMKSVKVPPVSTPIRVCGLEIDPDDILDVLDGKRVERLNYPLRVAFPGQRLKIGAYRIKVMNCHFTRPHKIIFTRGQSGDRFDPIDDLTARLIRICSDLERRTLGCIELDLRVGPPACF